MSPRYELEAAVGAAGPPRGRVANAPTVRPSANVPPAALPPATTTCPAAVPVAAATPARPPTPFANGRPRPGRSSVESVAPNASAATASGAQPRGALHSNAPGPLRLWGSELGKTISGTAGYASAAGPPGAAVGSAAAQPGSRAGTDQRACAAPAALRAAASTTHRAAANVAHSADARVPAPALKPPAPPARRGARGGTPSPRSP